MVVYHEFVSIYIFKKYYLIILIIMKQLPYNPNKTPSAQDADELLKTWNNHKAMSTELKHFLIRVETRDQTLKKSDWEWVKTAYAQLIITLFWKKDQKWIIKNNDMLSSSSCLQYINTYVQKFPYLTMYSFNIFPTAWVWELWLIFESKWDLLVYIKRIFWWSIPQWLRESIENIPETDENFLIRLTLNVLPWDDVIWKYSIDIFLSSIWERVEDEFKKDVEMEWEKELKMAYEESEDDKNIDDEEWEEEFDDFLLPWEKIQRRTFQFESYNSMYEFLKRTNIDQKKFSHLLEMKFTLIDTKTLDEILCDTSINDQIKKFDLNLRNILDTYQDQSISSEQKEEISQRISINSKRTTYLFQFDEEYTEWQLQRCMQNRKKWENYYRIRQTWIDNQLYTQLHYSQNNTLINELLLFLRKNFNIQITWEDIETWKFVSFWCVGEINAWNGIHLNVNLRDFDNPKEKKIYEIELSKMQLIEFLNTIWKSYPLEEIIEWSKVEFIFQDDEQNPENQFREDEWDEFDEYDDEEDWF